MRFYHFGNAAKYGSEVHVSEKLKVWSGGDPYYYVITITDISGLGFEEERQGYKYMSTLTLIWPDYCDPGNVARAYECSNITSKWGTHRRLMALVDYGLGTKVGDPVYSKTPATGYDWLKERAEGAEYA